METRLNKRTGIANKNRNMYTLILYKSITPQNTLLTPTDVGGCLLWLDGWDPAGNGSGTNGQTYTTIVDKSVNGNNATSIAGGLYPWTLATTKTTYSFKGVATQYNGFQTTNNMTDTDGVLTIIFLIGKGPLEGSFYYDTSGRRITSHSSTNATMTYVYTTDSGQDVTAAPYPSYTSITPYVYLFDAANGLSLRKYTDKDTYTPYAYPTATLIANAWSGKLSLCSAANGSSGVNGCFGHFSWYNKKLTDTQISGVVNYIMTNAV
jgi:hypothetical protein